MTIERAELLRVLKLVAEVVHRELFDMPSHTPEDVQSNRRKTKRRMSAFMYNKQSDRRKDIERRDWNG